MDKWLKNNLVVKILAIILAVMLWLVVNQDRWNPSVTSMNNAQSTRIERSISRVPVKTLLDSDEIVVVDMDKMVDVYLRGERSILSAPINTDSYEVYVDLRGYQTGKYNVPVKTKGFPSGIDVEIRPAQIAVTIETKQIKEMQVMTEVVGKPKEGYAVGEPIVNPLRVQVKASESQLKQIAFVKAFVNIEGATQNVKEKVALKVIDVNGNITPLELEPQSAEIIVPITHPFITLPLQINLSGEPPSGFAINKVIQDINQVSIFGTKEVISNMEIYDGPTIDVSQMTESQTVQVEIPKDPNLTDLIPDKVNVTIEIVPSEQISLTGVPVQLRGLPEEFTATIVDSVDSKLDLVLEGAPDLIKNLTVADLQANLILSGYTQGIHDVPLELILPKYVKLAKSIPSTIRVEIKDKTASMGDEVPGSTESVPTQSTQDNGETSNSGDNGQ